MDEKKDTKKKRVSFAPEPQVTYIYPEEENKGGKGADSGMMSEDEISVELTVDHLRTGEQQNGARENFLSTGLDDLMDECASSCSTKDGIATKENVCNEGGMEKGFLEEEGSCTQIEIPGEYEEEKDMKRGDGKEDTVWREDALKNEDEVFEDTLISNETVNVEEIINTQDLRKIIPQAKKEAVNVSELLVSKGIRFLDSLVVSNTRRDTMSKSLNEVHPRQEKFYESFLEPRTRFFLEFSSELEERMARQEKINGELERDFSISGTVFEREDASSQLRSLKTECRMRAKIEWYELRKEKEVEFNKEVTDRRNSLAKEYNSLSERLREVSELAEEKRGCNEKMEEHISRIKSRVGGDGEGKHQKISELKALINEQEDAIENARKEVRELEEERTRKQAEKRMLREALEKIEGEVEELEKTLKAQNVTEGQLKEARQEFRTMCAVFGVEMCRVDASEVRLKLPGYRLRICLEEGFVISSVEGVPLCDMKGPGLLYHYFGRYFGGIGLGFFEGIRGIASVSAVASSIHKEVEEIKRHHEVECHLNEEGVLVRILALDVARCTKHEVAVNIRNGFECLVQCEGKSKAYDLRKDIGVVSRSVEEALVNL
ncbi:hypothetical protein EHEL_081000 [Encephalitozoon hellem ATCC 50504]|uniref:Spc7 kinetochore protein n=1 Tax=Encephalitozoon hellem TaxID=27973 RepID=A0A9Q9FA24_ENCHE|nr:uncharacterized protein EHEL_081000 [Encephalitozoon hellem ATCC 50504]AFM98800.1 hypothetical protein EHEL_081000 [Encephalitozoon hellem ATCC 50504]UTX43777.1 Spc7 kinetochore protein [Encephalitozoon hellem]|eukprot:XP_003887781.1 hypothetical protein EHEL_081000 [Encephalitozoon hellem ATCC 50504]